MKQDTYTLHKPIRHHFRRNRVIVGGIDHQWQMDLADMQSMQKFNDGYRYLLLCIDVFSKYAWVVPLKNKTGLSLVDAFKIILASGRKPEKIITDQGTEFFNKHFKALLKDEDIGLYNTYITKPKLLSMYRMVFFAVKYRHILVFNVRIKRSTTEALVWLYMCCTIRCLRLSVML